MKKTVILFAIIFLSTVHGQWFPVNPGFYPYLDIQQGTIHADENVIMVPTAQARILKSFDKGKTWMVDEFRNTHSSQRITGMGSTKISFGFYGYYGYFGMKTTNNGGQWSINTDMFSTIGYVQDAESAREDEFIALMKTEVRRKPLNASTWQPVPFPLDTGEILMNVACFKNQNDYFILTSKNEVHHSSDQGATFNQVVTFPRTVRFIEAVGNGFLVAFVSDSTGNMLHRSLNKGITWDSIPVSLNFRQLRMYTLAFGFGFDESNNVYYTNDSMKTWQAANSPKLKETAIIKNMEAIGFDMNNMPWFTSDGGVTWEPRNGIEISDIRGLAILSQNEMFAVRRGGKIYRSGDHGYNWEAIQDSIARKVEYIVKESDNAFVIVNEIAEFYRFQQSPRSITKISFPAGISFPVLFPYDTTWVIADKSAKLRISTDRGASWYISTLPAARNTNFIHVWGSNIYLGQDSGYYMRSSDLGLTWMQKRVSTVAGDNILGIVGHGDTIFIALSASSRRYTEDGNSWTVVGGPVKKFFYCEPNHWYVYTNILPPGTQVLSTTNFGRDWIEDEPLPWKNEDVFYLDSRSRVFGILLRGNSLMVKYAMGTPVELSSFTAELSPGAGVKLNWSTASETNNRGFFVQKNSGEGWSDIAFIPGKGSSVAVNSYSYLDDDIPGTGAVVLYRLRQVDHSGEATYSQEVEVTGLPTEFTLHQNYPNPFNPSTVIRFALPIGGYAELTVYNSIGQKVATLVNQTMPAGEHKVEFKAANLPSGIYFYRLNSGNKQISRKMILQK